MEHIFWNKFQDATKSSWEEPVVMGLTSHIGNHIELWTCFLFLAKLFWNYWVVCHRNLIDLFTTLNCLSNFCVNNSLVICKWVSQRRHYICKYFFFCYVVVFQYWNTIYTLGFLVKEKAAVLGRAMSKSSRSQTKEFWLDLKICQICWMPSTFWNPHRNSILGIFC